MGRDDRRSDAPKAAAASPAATTATTADTAAAATATRAAASPLSPRPLVGFRPPAGPPPLSGAERHSPSHTRGATPPLPPPPPRPPPPAGALPPSHRAAHEPFVAACAGGVWGGDRDWNEEFQGLWTQEQQRRLSPGACRDRLRECVEQFEAHAQQLVEALVRRGDVRPPPPLPAVHCRREGNVILGVWAEAKLGQNYQRACRAVLNCRTPYLHLPLCASFRYVDLCVTAVAALPIDARAPPVYRGDGGEGTGSPRGLQHRPLRELLELTEAALNIAPAAAPGEEPAAVPGVVVYEGVDRRLYLLNPFGLAPPMRPYGGGGGGGGSAVPLRRWRHLVTNPPAPWGAAPLALYRRDAAAAAAVLAAALSEPADRRARHAVALLHQLGLGVCSLGHVALYLSRIGREEREEAVESLLGLACAEMVARAVRRVALREAVPALAAEGWTARALGDLLARTAGAVLVADAAAFRAHLLPVVASLFLLSAEEAELLTAPLLRALSHGGAEVTRRVCELLGLQVQRGAVARALCRPSAHNYGSVFDPALELFIATMARQPEGAGAARLATALWLPLRVERFYRAGSAAEAFGCARELIARRQRGPPRPFVCADVWLSAAVAAAMCGEEAASAHLLDRAAAVMDGTVAVCDPRGAARLPASLYFLPGRVAARCVRGQLERRAGRLDAAVAAFEGALQLCDAQAGPARPPLHRTRLYLEPLYGLIGVAAAEPGTARLLAVDGRITQQLHPSALAASLFGAELLGHLAAVFVARGMHRRAVGRLWDAVAATMALLGGRAPAVAEVLNRLAFAYYEWDVRRYGLRCSCVLHQAEAIMLAASGPHTLDHLAVVVNIVVLFIRCGRYVAASVRLHAATTPPPRHTAAVPRDHPIVVRLVELRQRLRAAFYEEAVVVVQRRWRTYASRLLVRAVQLSSARVLQRLGRGLLVRRLLADLARGAVAPGRLLQLQRLPALLLGAAGLLGASAFFSKRDRNWNGEYQHWRLTGQWWDRTSGLALLRRLDQLEEDFAAHARAVVAQLRATPGAGRAVPDSRTTIVCGNVAVTRVGRGEALPALHHRVCARLRRCVPSLLSAPLTALVGGEDGDYLAEALLPLHLQARHVLCADGRPGPHATDIASAAVGEVIRLYQRAGLALVPPGGSGRVQGVEVVRAADNQLYVVNVLGLVAAVAWPDADEAAAAAPPELPFSALQLAFDLCVADRQREAVELLEEHLIAHDFPTDEARLPVYGALVAARYGAGGDRAAAYRLFERLAEDLEQHREPYLALRVNNAHAHALFRGDAPPSAALRPLLRNCYLLRVRLRFHAYYAAAFVLEMYHFLLDVAQAAGQRVDAASTSHMAYLLAFGEPTTTLFVACERLLQYAVTTDQVKLQDTATALRTRRARALSLEMCDRFVAALKAESADLQWRGDAESAERCSLLLLTAIHLEESQRAASATLGVLLTRYAAVQTAQSHLHRARRALGNARRALEEAHLFRSRGPEYLRWRQCSHALNIRIHANARQVILRAVRRWRERRRRDAQLREADPEAYGRLCAVRHRNRMRRLEVSEGTARVYIAEEQAEGWYQLGRRQRRMRGNAVLRQTYTARMQIFSDKMASAMECVAALALDTQATLQAMAEARRRGMVVALLTNAHRTGRRGVIRAYQEDRVRLKLWHVEHVDTVLRRRYLQAFEQFILHCAAAEERLWRRLIESQQKRTKRQLGKFIARSLRGRQGRLVRSAAGDCRALENEEDRFRRRIAEEERAQFTALSNDFTFGREVSSESCSAASDMESELP